MNPATMNPATVYLSKWASSSDTYKTMRRALNRVALVLDVNKGGDAEVYPWHKLRFDVVRGVAARLKEQLELSPATINQSLTALRGVLEVAWRDGSLPDDAYRKIEVENVRGTAEPSGRALDPAELDDIEVLLGGGVTGRDDELRRALVCVLIGAGLRRVEAIKIRRQVYDIEKGRLRARGKGDKMREVPVGKRWRLWIEVYCEKMKPKDLLFPITRRQVSLAVERFCVENNLRPFTPHDLRKTFATHVCRVADVAIAQRLLGHANIQTTATIYDRRGAEAEDKAVEDL